MVGAVIFDQCIGMQIKTAHLAAKVGFLEGAFEAIAFFALANEFTFEESATQYFHGGFFVLNL